MSATDIVRRAFFATPTIGAILRLLTFIAICLALISLADRAQGWLLPGANNTTGLLVREVLQLLVFLAVSWGMGRLEGRTLADYGLPWRRMFGAQFWQGALLGFAGVTVLVTTMH